MLLRCGLPAGGCIRWALPVPGLTGKWRAGSVGGRQPVRASRRMMPVVMTDPSGMQIIEGVPVKPVMPYVPVVPVMVMVMPVVPPGFRRQAQAAGRQCQQRHENCMPHCFSFLPVALVGLV